MSSGSASPQRAGLHKMKRDAYGFVIGNDTEYTPQGFNTSLCSLAPEEEVGPYYVLGSVERSNITEGQQGFPRYLDILVMNTDTCEPLSGVIVDFWHANATGFYSGFGTQAEGDGQGGGNVTMGGGTPSGSMSMGIPSGSMTGNPLNGTMMCGGASATGAVGGGTTSSEADTGDEEANYGANTPIYNTSFLRGWQYTDENGIIKLKTIYPGWYQRRALHVHVKVFTGATVLASGTFTSGVNIHTGQLFFNDTLTEDMKNYYPYSGDENTMTRNSEDWIYTEQIGVSGLLNLVQLGSEYSSGFLGSITVGISGGIDDVSDAVSSSSQSFTSTTSTGSSTGTSFGTAAIADLSSTGTTISSSVPTNTSLATRLSASISSLDITIISIFTAAFFTIWQMTL